MKNELTRQREMWTVRVLYHENLKKGWVAQVPRGRVRGEAGEVGMGDVRLYPKISGK